MESNTTSIARGSCLCRAVRFEMQLPSKFCAHCHCDNCRRAHGAAFVTWIGFTEDRVRVTAGEEHVQRYETDTGATRTFCRRCGSTLFYAGPRWSGETHVALANVEDPVDRAPAAHVYVNHRADWFPITDELPQFGGTTGMEKQGED